MSSKAVAWALLAVFALAAVLLFNYWAAYQPLSTLVYTGFVLALAGLANIIVPFRFLGVRNRAIGALIFVAGVVLAFVSLTWPAATVHTAQAATQLDEIMPEYQFFEKHSTRVHARPDQVMRAVRESRFGDLKSFSTLMNIRSVALRIHDKGDSLRDKRVFDVFTLSGYVSGANDHEVLLAGGANARVGRPLQLPNLQAFAEYHEPGAVKMAFNFHADDIGNGWCIVTTETRVLATDDATRRGMSRYWRLIVPGSGLLRRQWLDAIKEKAESLSRT